MKKFFVLLAALAATSTVVVGSAFAQASTFGQREALGSAKSYLSMGGFSRAGLIHQLESPYGDHFSHADAVWGVNHAHANWNAEAVQAAKSYLGGSGHFSRAGLIHQLESPYGEHFTHAQAVYGVSVAYR
jgi:Host cell surface-exposed lipoprotein